MKEHVISVRLTAEEYTFMQRWSANSGLKVSDILRQLIENSRSTRIVNVQTGYVELNGRKIAYPQPVSSEQFQRVVSE